MQDRQHNRIFTYVAGAATVAIAAAMIAVGAPAASAATRTINVSGVITGFSQSTINVTAGETVSICLTSTDIDHDLTIASLNFKVVSAKGVKACKTLVVPKAAGTKSFICSIPGHASAGMKGNLVIKAAAGAPAPGAPAPANPAPGSAAGSGATGPQVGDVPVGGAGLGGGSTAGLTHLNLLLLGGGLVIAAMMSALLGSRVTRRD